MAKNFYLDNADLRFNMEHQEWELLFPLIEPDPDDPDAPRTVEEAKVLYHEYLHSLGEYIAEQIDPKAHLLDEQHPTLKDGEMIDAPAMKEFIKGLSDMGAMAMPFPRHVGGHNLPWLVANAVCEMTARADVSLMTYYGFFSGLGLAFLYFAIEEGNFTADKNKILTTRFDATMREMAEGKTCGAMCLTEPQAGSDLAQIRTTAKREKNGFWYVTGQKIWITCGHGEHHLVLARSESTKTHPGLKGLSLFYVPAHIEENGVRIRNFEISGQEKKMGQHSSVTATINYEHSRAELVGKRGEGFKNMLLVMNDARLLVGYEGIGLSEKVLRMAKDFANERVTMGKKIADHEMIAEYLDEMEIETKALRALAFNAGFHEEMANRLKAIKAMAKQKKGARSLKIEAQYKEHKMKARLSTPLVKYMAAENAVNFARRTMQIMGGVGYMKEYHAEKLMRDSLILPVYEGTSQIQALLVLKDHVQQAMKNPAKFVQKMAAAKIETLRAKTPAERALFRLESLYYAAMQSIMTRMIRDKFGDIKAHPLMEWKEAFLKSWDPKKDFSFGLLHAERFTIIASRLFMARVLVIQAQKLEEGELKDERLELAMRFMERSEPRMRGLIHEIEASKSSIFRNELLKKSEKKSDVVKTAVL